MRTVRRVVLLIALSAILGWVTFSSGGVSHTDQNFYLFALGLVALIAALWPSRTSTPRLSAVYRYLLPLLPAYAAFQILPLPASWIVALSPARAQPMSALAGIGITSPYSTLSVFPSGTRDYVLLLCGYVVVFLLVRQLSASWSQHPWMMVLPLLIIAAFEALLGIIQFSLGSSGTVARGTYVNRNHFAGLLELILPFAAAWPLAYVRKYTMREGISATEALKISGMWTLAAAFLVATIFSQSRMGFLATLFSLFVVGVLAVATRAHVLPSRRTVFMSVAGVVVVVLLAFVGAVSGCFISSQVTYPLAVFASINP